MKKDLESLIIQKAIKERIYSAKDFDRLKRRVASGLKLPKPSTASLNIAYHKLIKSRKIKPSPELERIMVRRAVRTLSGIAPITVLTKPFPCPGRCVYCPTEATMPKSYLSNEPAAMRALYLNFNPFAQVAKRLQAMRDNGHPVDKLELIVKGGTWSAYPEKYKHWFIKRCFDAANSFGRKNRSAKNLQAAQKINQTAASRVIGLTLETRPDWVTPKEIAGMRALGATRVELGVQSLDDDILEIVKRGHLTDWTIYATHLLKDAGFKVDYHMMPGLPGSTPAKDVAIFKKLFDDPRFRPDMIKIYPCVLLPNSELFNWWKRGKFVPVSEKNLVTALVKIKSFVPRYVRISRLVRDFPAPAVSAGAMATNLRQVIQERMKTLGIKCQCLRCREIGHNPGIDAAKIKPKLFTDKYSASGGTEYFLSFEDARRRVVLGFLRLRLPSSSNQAVLSTLPELEGAALIRELHVYGQQIELGKSAKTASQHKGLGRILMNQAESIAKKNGFSKIAVIAGIGVREYYKCLGYAQTGSFMIKKPR
ncbi:MAG: tRNA uridine(34) 5-carboxymethylaminomethyl modification radical SAM/GNAT enzyme Elp3 [Patescibacteria group bacterium]|nr:tRNA uridine(34) 5-carboxymethylaminomethyl modification radical SAM/GNAT enzyme Elp3 [Patescibacteria group bacterium]